MLMSWLKLNRAPGVFVSHVDMLTMLCCEGLCCFCVVELFHTGVLLLQLSEGMPLKSGQRLQYRTNG